MAAADAHWPDLLGGVIHAGHRVVSAHARHFLALSVLFLLPLSVLLLTIPSPFSASPRLHLLANSPAVETGPTSLFVAVAAIAFLLLLAAAAAIAHSVHRGFYGRTVHLAETLLAVPAAMARLVITLLATAVPATLLVSLLILAFRLVSLLHPSGLPDSGATILYTPLAAIGAVSFLAMALNWSLSVPVAVIESRTGFTPLLRSSELLSGMRCPAFSLLAFFSAAITLVLWLFSLKDAQAAAVVPVIAKTVVGAAAVTVLLLYGLVMNALLFMYCKALHGELVKEILDEYADEYVFLPFDDSKEPRVVTVVQ